MILLIWIIQPCLAIFLCDENQVVKTFAFEQKPHCPSQKEVAGAQTETGSVYLFKPNLNKMQAKAYRCRLHFTFVTTKRDCFFGLCSAAAMPTFQHYVDSVSPEECLNWIQTDVCPRCYDVDGHDPHSCAFKTEQAMRITTVEPAVKWATSTLALAEWRGVIANCEITEGNIYVKTPWDQLVTTWATIAADQASQISDSDYHGYRAYEATTIWHKQGLQDAPCDYQFQSQNSGYVISYPHAARSYLVVPDLQLSLSLLHNVRDRYYNLTHLQCADVSFIKRLNGSERVYSLPGDLIVVFSPSHRHKRSLHTALEGSAAIATLKLNYFLNVYSQSRFQKSNKVLEELCQMELLIFELWKLQAQIRPSTVVSHFMKRDVIARPNDLGHFDMLSCIDVQHFNLTPSLRVHGNQEDLCYSQPIVSLQNKTFQLDERGDRLVYPPLYFQPCSTAHKIFFVDGTFFLFRNSTLVDVTTEDPIEKNPIKIAHEMIPYQGDKYLILKNVPLYQKGDVDLSFVSGEEVMDYLNRKINTHAKYDNLAHFILGRDDHIFNGDILQIVTNIFQALYYTFLNPVLQFLVFLFILVPVLHGWFRAVTALFRKRCFSRFSPSS